jgi:hypothetical protein
VTPEPPGAATSSFWWLSFLDRARPLGVAIVPGKDFAAAVAAAWRAGCNPGGAVRGWRIPAGCPVHSTVVYRLMVDLDEIAVVRRCALGRAIA